ncbi:MAG: aminotransferase class I/II-fold pyridoxal phosphate-dependent enzyme, partial [Mailhella sp.]|nr:aminotransferase class I/II-fold pyridoxal phosphate-dependent enzyme [Mailhella sp.]
MKLANRLSRVKPSATLAVNAKALELKNRGVDVISLAVGEPDFPTPPHIAESAKKAIDEHFTRYTAVAGIPEIRAGICEYYQKIHGVSAKNENVIIGNGGKQCLYNLLLCLLNEGDDVLIPVPYWTSYPDMAALVGANPVFVPSSAENGYRISLGALDASLTPKTKLLLLNSP